MMQLHDLDVQHLKDIPGYKAILKAVIKTQIQQLVEQLSAHTGEESILLTASVSDGTLCNMGSLNGKTFLDGRDEIKSQFLRHCLKRSQKKRQQEGSGDIESDNPLDSFNSQSHLSSQQNIPHPSRVHPVSLTKVSHGSPYSEGRGRPNLPGEAQKRTFSSGGPMRQDHHHSPMKQGRLLNLPSESLPSSYTDVPLSPSQRTPAMSSNTPISRPSNIQKIDLSQQNVKLEELDNSSHDSASRDRGGTSESSQPEQSFTEPSPADRSAIENEISNLISSIPQSEASNTNSGVDPSNVKIEPITEGEMELEITGVEMAGGNSDSFSGDGNWLPNRLGYGSGADNETGSGQDGNQSGMGYKQAITTSWGTGENGGQGIDTSLYHLTQGIPAIGQSFSNDWNSVFRSPDGQFYCDFCEKVFSRKDHAVEHRRTHTGERPYMCVHCSRGFSQKTHLNTHMKRYATSGAVRCKECHIIFETECGFRAHTKLTNHMEREML